MLCFTQSAKMTEMYNSTAFEYSESFSHRSANIKDGGARAFKTGEFEQLISFWC